MPWVKIIAAERCRTKRGTFVEHDGHELAVFLLDHPDRVFVMENACPHASGNLAGGEIEKDVVVCPWHYWRFSLETGRCTHSPLARTQTYRAKLCDGFVWVDWPD